MENSNKMVVEMCSFCETEIEMKWDVGKNGYQAFCPVCGHRLMLCDECQHAVCEDGEPRDCDYCTETDSCMYHQPDPERKIEIAVKVGVNAMPKNCIMCRYSADRGMSGEIKCAILNKYFENCFFLPYKDRPDNCPLEVVPTLGSSFVGNKTDLGSVI